MSGGSSRAPTESFGSSGSTSQEMGHRGEEGEMRASNLGSDSPVTACPGRGDGQYTWTSSFRRHRTCCRVWNTTGSANPDFRMGLNQA